MPAFTIIYPCIYMFFRVYKIVKNINCLQISCFFPFFLAYFFHFSNASLSQTVSRAYLQFRCSLFFSSRIVVFKLFYDVSHIAYIQVEKR